MSILCRDKFCGKLHCRGEPHIIGVRLLKVRECFVLSEENAGFVPNGTICGQEKVNIGLLSYF